MAKAPAKAKNVEPEEDQDAKDEAAAGLDQPVKKRFSGKVIVIYIVLPLLVVLIGGGAGAYFLGFFGSDAEQAEAEHGQEVKVAVFYDLPEILVNLNSAGKKENYLKIRISLELEDATAQMALEPLMPRVIDNFQVFLREMRVEDLSGSAGMVRLKEELLHRINLSVQPLTVRDVLFKEMLIQ